jgi:hypothetical protein
MRTEISELRPLLVPISRWLTSARRAVMHGMARDPHTQREDERARQDDDARTGWQLERADRAIEQGQPAARISRCWPMHCGRRATAPIGAGTAPRAETAIVVEPEMIGDGRAYIYPIGDGPFCARCGTLMERVYRPGDRCRSRTGRPR